ncbi:MAG: hypothetical protein BA861_08890 [Desulfobacterales bacterium S3730MH5]|nr:MAG: hypothetical protein BA861_08890 [Desulfobacterales bacterium S3730MH5]
MAQYKIRWGTHKMQLLYLQVPKVRKSEILIESSSRHAILRNVITRMPKLVNRMSGEFLYKHFA